MKGKELNFCVAASGGGTTTMAAYEATKNGMLKNKAQMGLVIVSDIYAGIIQKLAAAGFPKCDVIHIPWRLGADEVAHEIVRHCTKREINFLAQFGLTPTMPKAVVEYFENGQMAINQHPERPKEFGGRGMHGIIPHQALVNFSRAVGRYIPGVVVSQRLAVGLDEGTVLNFKIVDWDFHRDNAAAVQQKKLPFEHQTQIETLFSFCEGVTREVTLDSVVQPGEDQNLQLARRFAIMTEEYPKWMRKQ